MAIADLYVGGLVQFSGWTSVVVTGETPDNGQRKTRQDKDNVYILNEIITNFVVLYYIMKSWLMYLPPLFQPIFFF